MTGCYQENLPDWLESSGEVIKLILLKDGKEWTERFYWMVHAKFLYHSW